jgi:hypothetical protein
MKSTLFGDAEVSVEPWKWVSAIWQLITLHLKMCVNHTTSSKSGLLSTTRSIYELKFYHSFAFFCFNTSHISLTSSLSKITPLLNTILTFISILLISLSLIITSTCKLSAGYHILLKIPLMSTPTLTPSHSLSGCSSISSTPNIFNNLTLFNRRTPLF